jgi:hypothetical protein
MGKPTKISPGWVIFLQIDRGAALPARFYAYVFSLPVAICSYRCGAAGGV